MCTAGASRCMLSKHGQPGASLHHACVLDRLKFKFRRAPHLSRSASSPPRSSASTSTSKLGHTWYARLTTSPASSSSALLGSAAAAVPLPAVPAPRAPAVGSAARRARAACESSTARPKGASTLRQLAPTRRFCAQGVAQQRAVCHGLLSAPAASWRSSIRLRYWYCPYRRACMHV